MTLLFLEALDFLNICRWFRLPGHGVGLLVLGMGLFRSLLWGLVFLDIGSKWFLPRWHGHGLLGQGRWPKPFGLGSGFLDINMGNSKSNQNHSLILIVSMPFLDRCLGSLNTCLFQHTNELGQNFIVRWKLTIWMKMYEIYFKEHIKTIYKIVNNPRPNTHKLINLRLNMHEL
jgi:hypothetical protein